MSGLRLSRAQIDQLNDTGVLTVVRSVNLDEGVTRTDVSSRSAVSDELQVSLS